MACWSIPENSHLIDSSLHIPLVCLQQETCNVRIAPLNARAHVDTRASLSQHNNMHATQRGHPARIIAASALDCASCAVASLCSCAGSGGRMRKGKTVISATALIAIALSVSPTRPGPPETLCSCSCCGWSCDCTDAAGGAGGAGLCGFGGCSGPWR